jgi:hypothetical protein
VRADDPLALEYDPAALALLPDAAVLIDAHLILYDACVHRSGPYGTDVARRRYDTSVFGPFEDYAAEPFAEVCRGGRPGISPWILAAMPIGDRVGIGFGLASPVGSGANQWGNEDGTITGVTGARRPTPTRYALVLADAIKVMIDFGIGVKLLDGLSVGLTLQWGIAHTRRVVTYTHPLTSRDGPSFDARSEVNGITDAFIPGLVGSVHAEPIRGLELMVGVSWFQDFEGSGPARITWGDFGVGASGGSPGTERTVSEIPEITLSVPQQTKIRGGARWASLREHARRRPRSARRDPLVDERFDVELDAVFEVNSRVDEVRAVPREGSAFDVALIQPDGDVTHTALQVPNSRVEKHWRNQITLHLGGDVVLVPGRFALRGGFSFESRGTDPWYLSVDFMPLQRLGIHAGGTLRLGAFDIDFAYAHLFQETVTVRPEQARLMQLGDGNGAIINAGTYRASWNMFSLGATWRL